MKIEVISFKLCPFVQRLAIVLAKHGIAFETTYIDINNPPDWFKKISPLGKVPVMRVDDQHVLFESGVLAEFADEIAAGSLLPGTPLERARQRAWGEFGATLYMDNFEFVRAEDEAAMLARADAMRAKLKMLEQDIVGPLFSGDSFQMIDAVMAPLFMRLALTDAAHRVIDASLPKVHTWADTLLADAQVQSSVVPEFSMMYGKMLQGVGGYLGEQLA